MPMILRRALHFVWALTVLYAVFTGYSHVHVQTETVSLYAAHEGPCEHEDHHTEPHFCLQLQHIQAGLATSPSIPVPLEYFEQYLAGQIHFSTTETRSGFLARGPPVKA